MIATTSHPDTRRERSTVARLRRPAMIARSYLADIAARWNAFVEAGQLGPDREREIGRHTGARI